MSVANNPCAPAADPALLERLRGIQVALISDQLHRNRRGATGLRPYHRPAQMAGSAVTMRTRGGGDLVILRAFEFCRPGDVMAVDADGECANAFVGGILTFYAATIGLAGMALDGAIRDAAEIGERTFPVHARGHTHRGPYKDRPGAINVPVSVGGLTVHPGDIVIGDRDGLLAFHSDEAETLIAKALARRDAEEGPWPRCARAAGTAPSSTRSKPAPSIEPIRGAFPFHSEFAPAVDLINRRLDLSPLLTGSRPPTPAPPSRPRGTAASR